MTNDSSYGIDYTNDRFGGSTTGLPSPTILVQTRRV